MITGVDSAAIFNHALLWGREGLEGTEALSAEGAVGTEGSESPTEIRQPQGATRGSEAVPQTLPLHTEMLGLDSSGPPPGAEALPEGDTTSLEMLMQSINSVGKDSGRGSSGGSSAGSGNSGNPDTSGETALPGKPSVNGSNGSNTVVVEQGGVGIMQLLLDLLQYDTKREQINGSVARLQTDSTQFQMTMEEKIQKLEDKIDGKDARMASKVFTWVALILGAMVAALTMGALSGVLAMVAGAIGLAVAIYSLAQQVAAEVTNGEYFVGKEWAMLLEACGVPEAEAKTYGSVLNSLVQILLSVTSAGMGLYAAYKLAQSTGNMLSAIGQKLAMLGLGGEGASIAVDAGAAASGMSVSSIDLQNGLTDAELQLLDAALKQMGITRDQLVAYLQTMMQNLDDLVAAVMTIFHSWQQTNSQIARSPSLM